MNIKLISLFSCVVLLAGCGGTGSSSSSKNSKTGTIIVPSATTGGSKDVGGVQKALKADLSATNLKLEYYKSKTKNYYINYIDNAKMKVESFKDEAQLADKYYRLANNVTTIFTPEGLINLQYKMFSSKYCFDNVIAREYSAVSFSETFKNLDNSAIHKDGDIYKIDDQRIEISKDRVCAFFGYDATQFTLDEDLHTWNLSDIKVSFLNEHVESLSFKANLGVSVDDETKIIKVLDGESYIDEYTCHFSNYGEVKVTLPV